jgi:hypothetical protein
VAPGCAVWSARADGRWIGGIAVVLVGGLLIAGSGGRENALDSA